MPNRRDLADSQHSGLVLLAGGAVGAPSLAFAGDPDTGIYSDGANILSFATQGSQRLAIQTSRIQGLLPFQNVNGSASSPAFSFSSDQNSGMYSVVDNSVGISAAGTLRLTVSSTDITPTVPLRASAGSATEPSLSFSSDSNTGIYNPSANQIGFSTAGSLAMQIGTDNVSGFVPFRAPVAGSAAAYGFIGDTNTGLWSPSADAVNIITGGSSAMRWTTTYTQAVAQLLVDDDYDVELMGWMGL